MSTKTRGFASMSPTKRRAVARKGGKQVQQDKVGYRWNSESAKEASQKAIIGRAQARARRLEKEEKVG